MRKDFLKKSIVISLAIVLICSSFAGCGPKKDKSEGSATHDSLTIAIDADISTLHPSDYSTTSESHVLKQIYDTLLFYEDPSDPDYDPRIAESVDISDDKLTYTFHLRKDATFHDGTPITAEDVKFSLELYAKSSYQGAYVDNLGDIKVIDETTVAVSCQQPFSPFLNNISNCHIASKAYFDSVGEKTFSQTPVGSGPYALASREAASKIVLQAYDNYYRGAAPIKNVTYKILADPTTVSVGLQTGEIDMSVVDGTTTSDFEGDSNVIVDQAKETTFFFIAMNLEKYPYSETKFRQAINYAIDRQNVIDLVANGVGTANSNLLTPDRFGWSKNEPTYSYDPEKAKSLLAEMGLKTPYDLGTMYIGENYSTEAQVIQYQLEQIGLTTKIEILETNAYYAKLCGGECGISVLKMTLDGDTQNMGMALTTDYIGMANNARYSDPEIDQWFKDALACENDEQRQAMYEKIFTKVQNEAVYAVVYNPIMLYAHSANLQCPEFLLEGFYHLYDFSWK